MAGLVVSYSRADRPIVRALVALLRAGLRSVDKTVFWDEDFEPGEPWFVQLTAEIDATPQLFVCWCHHASASPQVRREYIYAIDRRKRVVPVLLDDTPLSDELSEFHGIDLRGVVWHVPATPISYAPMRMGCLGQLLLLLQLPGKIIAELVLMAIDRLRGYPGGEIVPRRARRTVLERFAPFLPHDR